MAETDDIDDIEPDEVEDENPESAACPCCNYHTLRRSVLSFYTDSIHVNVKCRSGVFEACCLCSWEDDGRSEGEFFIKISDTLPEIFFLSALWRGDWWPQ